MTALITTFPTEIHIPSSEEVDHMKQKERDYDAKYRPERYYDPTNENNWTKDTPEHIERRFLEELNRTNNS